MQDTIKHAPNKVVQRRLSCLGGHCHGRCAEVLNYPGLRKGYLPRNSLHFEGLKCWVVGDSEVCLCGQ